MLHLTGISPIPLKVSAYSDSIDVCVTCSLLHSSTEYTNLIRLRSRLDCRPSRGGDDVSTTYNSAFLQRVPVPYVDSPRSGF